MSSVKIAMLGLGSMNGAILAGLLGSGVPPENVTVTNRSEASAQRSRDEYGVTALAEESAPGPIWRLWRKRTSSSWGQAPPDHRPLH
ncbi:NAD(P)-binding domain-containing protein [Nesterenkonia pannonica]|uniref:pyrroline-5-carboxylate reductase family protein n=1 Tax=Nesterenkonia pannonica TaxID=1548602 RepID=UPI0021647C34|nr:NAD(P)-binding domain-containing protein [Nesterenkonia pannonica]